MIGVGKGIKGLTDVSCFALAKNNWPYSSSQSLEFAEQAVSRRGSTFRDLVGHGNKSKQATIKCRFADSPFTVYYVGFEANVELQFEASINY